ncbi:hypothetical protein [Candidatus Berkiella aquae]|uniref:Uncharacterized protein n=1 Tax=Candidatus Berkiella aquae TaxID=295108 RepID=A0A0Q9YXP6_9GAMM|nr:hypothetical protein [Candidatus Berkiella aquae]MCS5710581.1 hypothetical protein [Candidatus Berkiella aquae]
MFEGPSLDISTIDDELWGMILALLSVRDRVHFQMTGKVADKSRMIDTFWSYYFPSTAVKQYEEIQYLKDSKIFLSNLMRDIPELLHDETIKKIFEQKMILLSKLDNINRASSLDELKQNENLLDSINIGLIKLCFINDPDVLNLYGKHFTRFPLQLLQDETLQDCWKKLRRIQWCNSDYAPFNVNMLKASKILKGMNDQLIVNDDHEQTLTHLECSSNSITSPDASDNSQLTELVVAITPTLTTRYKQKSKKLNNETVVEPDGTEESEDLHSENDKEKEDKKRKRKRI